MPATRERPPITVTREGGLAFSTEIRGHRIVVDQPVHAGGADAGPAPLELLGASLGSCVALYVHQFCAARGIPDDDLRVEVVQHGARDPARIGRFSVRVLLGAEVPERYLAMLERVARSCPAHNTLAMATEIEVELSALAVV